MFVSPSFLLCSPVPVSEVVVAADEDIMYLAFVFSSCSVILASIPGSDSTRVLETEETEEIFKVL